MKTFKKALAVVLCVIMTLTAAPLNGFVGLDFFDFFNIMVEAQNTIHIQSEEITTSIEESTTEESASGESSSDVLASGQCGENLTWTLFNDGELVIDGEGAMSDWSSFSEVPWNSYSDKIILINIGSEVTTIGSLAFESCDSLSAIHYFGSDEQLTVNENAFGEISIVIHYCTFAEKTPATCTQSETGEWYCEECDENFTSDAVIPSLGHDWSNRDGVCARDNCSYECEHPENELTWETVTEATCTPGLERAYCNICNIQSVGETMVVCDSSTYPESGHNYSNNYSRTWRFSYEGAKKLVLKFSSSTQTESNYDYIYIYNSAGVQTGKYSGTQLAGAVIELEGSSFSIKLTSDSSQNYYGFKFDSISAVVTVSVPGIEREIPAKGHDWSEGNGVCAYGCGTECEHQSYTQGVCDDCGGTCATIGHVFGSTGDVCLACGVAGGACGDSLIWALGENGKLEIDGTGDMYNFSSASDVPWYTKRTSITSIVIADGVTSIGNYAFYSCAVAAELTMPVSTKIYSSAYTFGGCKNIEKITLTKGNGTAQTYGTSTSSSPSYTYYGYTPWYISGCETIVIEDSITGIGDYAFYNCTGITELTMPISAKIYNSSYTFGGCTNIKKVTLTKGNGTVQTYGTSTSSSSSYTYYGYTPWYISDCIEIVIADDVTSIGDNAFYECTGITSVTIPDSVTSIGRYAFYRCTGITSVTIGNGVTSIGSYAFYGCAGITIITIPDSVTSIGSYAFYGCAGITSVTIGNSVTSIGSSAFKECTALENVYYSGDIVSWCAISFDNLYANPLNCADNLYINNELVAELVIPDSVTSIGSYAFCGCTSIISITIPDSVTSIGSYAFCGCTSIISITIPDSVTSIGYSAFKECTALENVYYTGDVAIWCAISFGDLYANPLNCADNLYINNELVAELVIPDSITLIKDYAFYGCDSIKSIIIPDSVTLIADTSFAFCSSLTSIIVSENNDYFSCDKYGVLYSKDKTKLILYPAGNTIINYTIPFTVLEIGANAFCSCPNLMSAAYEGTYQQWCCVNVGENNSPLTAMLIFGKDSDRPFYLPGTCGGNLEWVLYTDGELVISGTGTMKNYSTSTDVPWFRLIENITSVSIADGVTSIGDYAFYNCTGITELTMPISAKIYNSSYTFGGCTNIKKVTLTKGNGTVQTYGTSTSSSSSYTYYGYTPWYISDCIEIVIADDVTSIGSYAFYKCTGITSVTIGNSVTSIGSDSFYGCTGITSITIPDSVTSIHMYAFYECSNINQAYYDGTLEQWENVSVDVYNTCLTSAMIFGFDNGRPYNISGYCGENIKWILYLDGELCFIGSGDLPNYSLSNGYPKSANTPWYSVRSAIKSVAFDENITYIGENTFYDCQNIRTIKISGYDVVIANGVFDDCDNADILCLSGSSAHAYAKRNNITYTLIDGDFAGFTIMNDMVVNYSGTATNPIIPSGITSIGSYAFMDNDTITSIVLPNTVTNIYTGAFAGCDNLIHIVIPESVSIIASTAFNDTDVVFACVENSYAHIYAVENGIACELTNPETGIEFLSHNEYIPINGKMQLSVVVTSGNKSVIWSSTDSTVASVDSNGLVTANKAGNVVIIATTADGMYKDYCLVHVVGITASLNTNTVVDAENGYIYGLNAGIDSLSNYIELADNSCTLEYDTLTENLGTGTVANVVRDDSIIDSYTVVIFGDLNGDGWYDGEDAFLVNLIVVGLLTEDKLPDYVWKAADCNHDGLINEIDVDLLMGAGVRRNDIDQNATHEELVTQAAYIEYASIIDQSAGLHVQLDTDDEDLGATKPEINETVETDESAFEMDVEVIITNLFEFFKKIFALVLSFIIK